MNGKEVMVICYGGYHQKILYNTKKSDDVDGTDDMLFVDYKKYTLMTCVDV
jgi:hypothetical protein